MTDSPKDFIFLLTTSLAEKRWVKLLLSKYSGDEAELKSITIRPVQLKGEAMMSWVYRYQTRDITKNRSPEASWSLLAELLGGEFRAAHLFETDAETQIDISLKGKCFIHRHASKSISAISPEHDQSKKRFIDIQRPYLQALGVTDKQHQLIPAMSAKWKQINKFIEIFEKAFCSSGLDKNPALSVVDFGSGKGYLTFSIHDYLHHTLENPAAVTGVELREPLVTLCNKTASHLGYRDLAFVCGDVKTHAPQHCDVMIALHACDTATDYAIHYGIRAGASIIMCAPCCHKQIRPQLHSPSPLKPILQYGVHLGQEAEMITDSLRALLLEANGYNTKVFEFISLEHTDKNKMILAVKRPRQNEKKQTEIQEQINAIKQFYGIQEHCLEQLLKS